MKKKLQTKCDKSLERDIRTGDLQSNKLNNPHLESIKIGKAGLKQPQLYCILNRRNNKATTRWVKQVQVL